MLCIHTKEFEAKLLGTFDDDVMAKAGSLLGVLIVLQALHRELDVGETRVGVCGKAKQITTKPFHSVAPLVWRELLAVVPA